MSFFYKFRIPLLLNEANEVSTAVKKRVVEALGGVKQAILMAG